MDAIAGDVVVDVVPAAKATTFVALAARRRPPPTLGVGKWLAGTPIEAICSTVPVEGSRP